MAQAGGMPRGEYRVATGMLNGESGEYVYDADGFYTGIPGYKFSELKWELNDVHMLGVGGTYHANKRMRFNLDYWVNAGEQDGTMDDYDWVYVGSDWSHWSHHDNTAVTTAEKLDLNGDFTLYASRKSGGAISALVGYRQDRFGWESSGGYGIYSDTAYRDTLVLFSDVPVISYEQTYRTPYIGVAMQSGGRGSGRKLQFDAKLRYSQWVSGEDVDHHLLRYLRFEEEGSGGDWIEYDVSLTYLLNKRASLNIAYSAQEYDEIKASTTVTDLLTGATTLYAGDSAGLDHSSQQLTLGFSFQL
jgi:plasminogen activator